MCRAQKEMANRRDGQPGLTCALARLPLDWRPVRRPHVEARGATLQRIGAEVGLADVVAPKDAKIRLLTLLSERRDDLQFWPGLLRGANNLPPFSFFHSLNRRNFLKSGLSLGADRTRRSSQVDTLPRVLGRQATGIAGG